MLITLILLAILPSMPNKEREEREKKIRVKKIPINYSYSTLFEYCLSASPK